MPSLADYMVLSDETFEVKDSFSETGQKTFTFTLPSDFTAGTNFARPVLAFIVSYLSSSGSVGVWVNPTLPLLQSQRELTITWQQNTLLNFGIGLWEALQGPKFKPGEENKIVFAMQAADKGDITFRDVVLWFQRGSGA